MKYYLLAAAVFLFAALVAFGVPVLMALQGTKAIVFIVVVLLLGIAAAVAILIWHFRAKKSQGGDVTPGGATGELDVLLNDANRKLRESQHGPKSLDGLPVIYILGETGTAKTTTVIRSGLDPELVAGAVPREGESVPTAVLNLWFTRIAALLEVGATVRANGTLLTRLVERTRPKAYRSAFGTGAAPRAAIVCVSAEQLLVADGGASLMASARNTGNQLREISRLLGATLPAYVIVTKLDRVPNFEEYVRNLSNEEVRQILGSPLPRSQAAAGVYADEASRTLAGILDGLCYKLGEFRVEMLERETEPRNAPAVYEFPREFGKLRKNLNQYLVELSKPSQLSANPYLRGFYFTGIRAQMVERMVNAPVAEARPQQNDGATQYLNISLGKSQAAGRAAPQPTMQPMRVPQWAFLPRLLPEIILGDKSALSSTNQTAPARLFRRILYGTLGFVFLVYTVLLAISFVNNRGIESRIQQADQRLTASASAAGPTPTLADLGNLDAIRQVIVQLDGYNNGGESHWGYRFGLYRGDQLEDRAKTAYFRHFLPMLLAPTQARWIYDLQNLLDKPAVGADFSLYGQAYRPLKAYLITAGNDPSTASNHQYSSLQSMNPTFYDAWAGSRQIDPPVQQLAQTQIDFYANELVKKDPYSISPNMAVVTHARGYLDNFLAEDRIYLNMLNLADKNGPGKTDAGVDFKTLFPNARDSVTDTYHVRGAYTSAGFAFMQDALKHPERYKNGEPWVLGDQSAVSLETTSTSANLQARYSAEYIKEWRAFLAAANVAPCGGLHEAPIRLAALTGSGSPILELFYTVSHNTTVNDPAIQAAFKSSQTLVAPNATDHFDGPGNSDYLDALLKVSEAIKSVADNPAVATDPAVGAQILALTDQASTTVVITARKFPADPTSQTDKSRVIELMNMPINCAIGLAKGAGKAGADGAGQKLCNSVSPLLLKFPFTPKSGSLASVGDVNQVFAPDTGAISTSYNTALNKYLMLRVAEYQASPTSPLPVNPRFVQSFNRLAHVASVLYPPGAKSPALNFTLRFLQASSPGITSATFNVDGKQIPTGQAKQDFTWNGESAQKAALVVDSKEKLSIQGNWALFQLVHDAHITKSGGVYRLDYDLNLNENESVNGHVTVQSGASTKTVSFELSGPGADLLAGDGLTGLGCVANVAK